jgi:hypothetical protein
MNRHTEAVEDFDSAEENSVDSPDESNNKTKQEIRIEKHTRLLKYQADKELRDELDHIDGW